MRKKIFPTRRADLRLPGLLRCGRRVLPYLDLKRNVSPAYDRPDVTRTGFGLAFDPLRVAVLILDLPPCGSDTVGVVTGPVQVVNDEPGQPVGRGCVEGFGRAVMTISVVGGQRALKPFNVGGIVPGDDLIG